MKTCPTCKRDLPYAAFGRATARRDGLHSMCRECRGARGRAAYAEQRETVTARRRELYGRQAAP
jgi:hypothetical protein